MKEDIRFWFGTLFLIAIVAGCGSSGGGGGITSISNAKAITAFSFISPAATGIIDENAKTITVTVPHGTNVTTLTAMFTTTGLNVKVGAIVQVSGMTANNFTSPVAYVVTAADGSTTAYTVTVTVSSSFAKAITAFSFISPATTGNIDENAKTIDIAVPYGTNVTALVATFTTTGASVKVGATAQVSGTTANNFTNPVIYTVTAADSTTESYIVTVTVATSAIILPKTGQTICSDSTGTVIACTNTGQNGELQRGVAWPVPRFAVNADTTITDNLTGLVWTQYGNVMPTRDSNWDMDGTTNDGGVTWQHALDYVAKLNTENYLGHNDWRLPNIKELKSLVNYSQSDIATWLNSQGFTNVQAESYWSSTSQTAAAQVAWSVYMYGGGVEDVPKSINMLYVWPVRSGQGWAIAEQPKTGQTSCYDSAGTVISCATTTAMGQDGALQKGVDWPNLRFSTNADTSVTDNLTGLVWVPNGNVMPTRDSNWDMDGTTNDGGVTWQHALDYVAKLNVENYLGHNDWRLPDVIELESLVNYGESNSATWLNAQGFTNVQVSFGNYYWSSTSSASDASTAWFVGMTHCLVLGYRKTNDILPDGLYVWPVRAGQ
jgi:hypothetical protein